jgi:hypothetical protein
MRRASGVVVRVGAVGAGALLAMACASEPGGGEAALSPEMRQAIDTFVELRAPIPAGSPADVARDSSSTTRGTSQTSLGGLDAAQLSGALTAGASGVPVGGAAAGASAAGNGGVGAGSLGPGGPASGGTAAGFGGAASGASSGGGLATFADAACYLVGRLCSYIARCVGERPEVCAVPSACPALVADALAKSGNPPIPPQAGVVIRCVGDAIGSASCVREELASGLKSSLDRCGISRAGDL